jgi:N utilization substance protein A
MSKDKDVDAVGACVGMKGMRVQSIIRELRGEKIDIIEYHEDAVTFAEKALQPAKVSRVTIVDSSNKHLEVIVDDTQLSLAIGKKGQNVRLAAKLLGWKIDIKSEEEKRQEVEQQMSAVLGGSTTPLEQVPEMEPEIISALNEGGITTVEALADMTPEELEAIPGIGPETVEKISIAVNNYFSSLEASEQATEAPSFEEPIEQAPSDAEAPREELGPDSAGQAGDNVGLSDLADAAPESVDDLVETEQNLEAAIVSGVENAPPADEAEVTVHEKHPDEDEIPPEKK